MYEDPDSEAADCSSGDQAVFHRAWRNADGARDQGGEW